MSGSGENKNKQKKKTKKKGGKKRKGRVKNILQKKKNEHIREKITKNEASMSIKNINAYQKRFETVGA